MWRWQGTASLAGGGCVLAGGMLLALASPGLAATAGGTAPSSAAPFGATATPDGRPLCSAPSRPALAARMSAQVAAALQGRSSTVGLAVTDAADGLSCAFQASRPFEPGYCLAVLTDNNPTMAYGVQTVSGIARAVNQDLNSRLALRAPAGPASRARTTLAAMTPAGTTRAPARPVKGGGTAGQPSTHPAPRSLPHAGVRRPSLLDWLGGAFIAAALALLVAVAHLRRRPRTVH